MTIIIVIRIDWQTRFFDDVFFFSGEMLIIGIFYKNDVDALKVKIQVHKNSLVQVLFDTF
jgi:hypothetical protein